MGYLQLAAAVGGAASGTGETSSPFSIALLALALVVCSFALAVIIRAPSVDVVRRHAERRARRGSRR